MADRTSMVNTRSYRISTNSDFTVPGLLLSVHPSLAYLISWDERWAIPWNVDTTKTWPQITVAATYPGASAKDVSESVTSILEEEINGAKGMLYFESSSSNGSAEITVTFKPGTDLAILAAIIIGD